MSALGKVLVFVVLLLALVWNALVVNAYVTRVNWKTELDKTQKKLVETAEAANSERQKADRTREAADAVVAQLKEEIVRLRASEKTLSESLESAKSTLSTVQKTEEGTQTLDQIEKANAQKTQKQVDTLQTELNKSEMDKNKALIKEQVAQNRQLEAEIKQKSAERRAEELEAKLLKANDPNFGKGVGSIRPQVDKDFKATVLKVDAAGDVVISLGANARLQKGAVLQLSRYKPEAKFVGTLTITSVDPYNAVGRFTAPATIAKPGPNDLPKAGDTVSVIE
jgi:predicted RND superfamily exporter protein